MVQEIQPPSHGGKVEFIEASDAETEVLGETEDVSYVVPDFEQTLVALSKPQTKLTIPRNKNFNRKQVVDAFQDAFELIGGVPRLALWAHTNPNEFYKLYGRLLPAQSSTALGEANEVVIKHVLPRSPLDE